MSVSDAEFRTVVFDAIKGLDALTTFIETRLEMADSMEAAGMEEAAVEVRAVWTRVWDVMSGAPRRALLAELHEFMDPTPFDEADEDYEDFDEDADDPEGFEGHRLANNA